MALRVEPEPSCSTSVLPWIWILEELLDVKDVGTPLLKEMITAYIPNLESQSYGGGSLQKRIALRYLEELLALYKIDACAIPLVKALLTPNPIGSLFHHSLLLRVQTEAVLTNIRGRNENGERDWKKFKDSLNHVFPAAEDADDVIKECRKELMMLLEAPDFEKECTEIFERYSLHTLRQDLFQFIILQKGQLGPTFLDQKASNVACDKAMKQQLNRKRRRTPECHRDELLGRASISDFAANIHLSDQQPSAKIRNTNVILADCSNASDDSEVANWNVECCNYDGSDHDLDKVNREESISKNEVDGTKKKVSHVSEPQFPANLETEEHQSSETRNIKCKQEHSRAASPSKAECQSGAVNADVIDGHDGDLEEEVIREKADDDMQKSEIGRTRYPRRRPVKSYREVRIIPGLRRKNLPWSKLEVDTLKEGVKRFSDHGVRSFQWARILEFGHGKFDISRTSIDLKDKWRNLSKGGLC